MGAQHRLTAEAGVQKLVKFRLPMDSGLRRNDGNVTKTLLERFLKVRGNDLGVASIIIALSIVPT